MNDKQIEKTLPRIGQIHFSNCLPINLPIKNGTVEMQGQFIDRVPNDLNKLIMAGELDVSAVSLFCYLNSQDLTLVPGLSVASLGPVGSVLFFYEGDLKDLGSEPLLVPDSSATSINLLSIILHDETGSIPDFVREKRPDIEKSPARGALIIGDDALKVDGRWSSKYNRIDLGKWWHDRYNLPMVFGVWAARAEFASQNPDLYAEIVNGLNQARDIGLSQMLEEVVDEASKHMLIDKSRVRKYFLEELDYNLGDEHRRSIDLYRRRCEELSLLKTMTSGQNARR